jgi:hypothetical protein
MLMKPSRQMLWIFIVACALVSRARPLPAQERFTSGQNVAPVFEGWVRNADGSFDFYYGYLNRNWTEEPSIPTGPANTFSPGPADREQPTYFYPRRNQSVFKVSVPKDWGPKTELIWTLTVNGKTDQAFGWLKPEWEIDALLIARNAGNQGGRTPEEIFANKPPSVAVDPVQTVTLPNALKLTTSVSDDALPTPLPKRTPGRGLATLTAVPAPMNVPTYTAPLVPRNDLSVRWILYRGPAKVTFDPPGYQIVKADEGKKEEGKRSGKAVTTATFAEPGTYVLRAIAADGVALNPTDVTVTVAGKSTHR